MSYNERSPSPARGGGWGGGGEDEGRGGGGGARRSPLPPVGRREDDYPSSMGAQDGYGLPRRPRSPMDDDRRGNGGGGKRRRSPSPLPPSRSERDVYIPSYGRERSPPSYRDAGSRRGGPPPGSDYYGGGGYGGYGGYGSYGGGGGGYAYGGGYDRFDDRGSSSYGRDPYDPYAAPPSSRYDSQRLPPSTSRSSMKPPEDLSYLAPFSYYRDFMRDEDPRLYDDKDGLEESYTKYKRSFLYKANKELFAEIKGMSWCKERYGITQAEADDRRRLKIKGREGKLDAFLSALAKGEWDDLLLDQRVIAPPPTPAKRDARLLEVDSEGKVIDREVSAKAEGGDEEHKPAVKVEGTDEQSTDATMKEESNGADADQKPKVEGDGEGKSESAVPVAAKTEGESEGLAAAPAQNGAQDYQQQKRNEEDSILIPAAPNTLLIKTLPPDLSRADLEAHCSQVEGCDYVALAEPNPTKRFHRIGWVVFKPDADMASAVEKLCESKINNFTLHMDLAEKLTYQRMRVTPAAMGTPERTRETLAHIKQVSAKLEAQASEESPEEAKEDYSRGSAAIEARLAELRSRPKSETDTIKPETADDVDAVNAVEVERLEKLELDLHIQYLRSVFNVCYYCLYSADFPEELTKKCVKHVRRNLASPVGGKNRKEQEQAWIKNFDEKAILLLDREKANALDFGGESYQDELTRLCKDHIQVEDDSKFRCKTCKKLFKAAPFVEKHIMNKHPEVIGDKLDQLKYFNNFVLDPAHVSAPAEPTAYSMSGAPYPSGYGASAAYSGMASTFGAFNQMFNPSYGGGYGSMMGGAYPPLSGGYGASAPMFAAQPVGGAAGFSAGGYGGYGGGNLSGGARALGERIGDRGGNGYAGGYGAAAGIPAGPGSASKRQRRDPPAPPKGAKLDPRAGKLHAYTDLDGPPASGGGDDTMLDY